MTDPTSRPVVPADADPGLAPLRRSGDARGGVMRRWGLWVAILAMAVAALMAGAGGNGGGPQTPAARAATIAAEVRCPTCRGLSAAESDAKAARAIRTEIRRRVDAGDTNAEIKTYLASRYGDDILLRPPSSGAGALVWVAPVAGFVAAAAGLAFAFRRWSVVPEPARGPAAAPAPLTRAPVSARRVSTRRTAFVTAAIALVAVGVGVALAAAAGDRRMGDPLSGSIEGTSAARDPRLDQAQEYMGTGKAVEAVKLYDAILREDPEQVEALAYRGWLLRLAGLPDEGLVYLDRAVAADPSYPDAHFFRGMVLWQDKGDPAAGAAEFRLFLANDPPQAMVGLVEDALNRALADAAAKGQAVPTSTTVVAPADPEGG